MSINLPQNPGISGLDELTTSEELFVQNIAGLTYAQGDILYYDGTNLANLGPGTSGQFLKTQGAAANPVWATVSGTGDVVGPASATDNAIARFDLTTGKLIQNSGVTIDDSGNITTTGIGSFASLTVSGTAGAGYVTFPHQSSSPTSPGAGIALLSAVTGNGFTRIIQDNEALEDIVIGQDSVFVAKNTSGGAITKGQVVYVTGSVGAVPTVSLAKADAIATINATIGIATETTVANNAFGQFMIAGIINNMDTSAFVTGNTVYVSAATAGALTTTKPAYPNFQKFIGVVLNSGVGNGSILINVAPFNGGAELGTNAAIFYGTNIQLSGLTASEIVGTDASKNLVSLAVATYPSLTELTYVKGVTSAIQTQLGTKAPLASPTFTGTVTMPTGLTGVLRADTGVVSVDTDVTDIVTAASLTAAGKVELSTTAEINTGTDTTRAMPVDQFVASNRNVRYVLYRIVDATTAVAVATTKGGDLEFPFTGTITEIGAYVDTAGTTGTMTVDVNIAGTTIMTTNKITIDTAEKSSRTAATAPALTTTAITAGDILTFDIDAIHTTPANGLTVRLGVRLT